MPNCYKCHTTENLSVKTHKHKTGYKLFICKPCRREAWRKYEVTHPKPIKLSYPFTKEEWERLAVQSRQRISERYKTHA